MNTKNFKVPVVSVLMPTFNRAELLKRAVRSVLSQSFEDFELVVVNDASTDGTREVLEKFKKEDSRVHPIHHEKNNYPDISGTLNEGMVAARGRYIARLDDDDYWCDPDKLKKQVEFLESHPDHVVTGGGTIVIDENDNERYRYFKTESDAEIRDKALLANPFTHSTVMFLRNVALECGGYGNFKNAEDWDLWLRMGLRGKFHNHQEYFVRYLLTDTSKTVLFKRSQSREMFRLLASHRKEYRHFLLAYSVNFAQFCYSLLPSGIRAALYTSLSKLKRTAFSQ